MSTPSSYLRYLPAIYSGQESAFIGDYLKIFEKLLSGIDDDQLDRRRGIQELLASEVIGNLFYPRLGFLFDSADTQLIPPISGAEPEEKKAFLADLDSYIRVPKPTDPLAGFPGRKQPAASSQDAVQAWLNGFLNWLGGWVDLTPENSWSIDKKRNVIAQILALYRLRGTPQGLKFLIDLLLDLPLKITGIKYQAKQDEVAAGTVPIPGQITVSVSNPTPPCIEVSDQVGRAFIVKDRYQPDTPVVSGYFPWLFEVLITLPNASDPRFILTRNNVQQILLLQQQLQQLLASVKPAASKFIIRILPSMQLEAITDQTKVCNAGTLGVNTLLGIKGTN